MDGFNTMMPHINDKKSIKWYVSKSMDWT